MNVLISGAAGFVGRHVCDLLSDSGHHIVALHRPGVAPLPQCQVAWTPCDLADAQSRLPDGPCDVVVHLAQSRHYREFPAQAAEIFAVNTAATLRLLDHARANGARRFVHASTANVYAPDRRRLDEKSPMQINSFYASSKRAAEMIVEAYGGLLGAAILRFFTIYGPGQSGMLIPNLIERVRKGHPVAVQGERGLPVSPLYVADAAAAIQAAVEDAARSGVEIFNVGGRECLTIRDIGDEIGRALSVAVRFERVEGADPVGWWADSSRITARWGVTPAVDFAAGLRRTLLV